MTLHFQVQPGGQGVFNNIDPAVSPYIITDVKLSRLYNAPAKLEFTCVQPEQSLPFNAGDGIIFWDDSIGYSAANPCFRGFVEMPTPGGQDANKVKVLCYDNTRAAAVYIYAMNAYWTLPTGGHPGDRPVPADNAYPRVVFNVHNFLDDDYAYTINGNDTVADILRSLFNYQLLPLQYWGVAPPSPAVPWVDADLAPMTYHPQYKIVCESTTFRAALDIVLKQEPRYKYIWHPGTQQWRFYNIHASPTATIATNASIGGLQPLDLSIARSIQDRATAVKIFGPERKVPWQVGWVAGTLTPIDRYGVDACGTGFKGDNIGHRAWQIVDPAKRRIVRLLPQPIWVNIGQYAWVQSYIPVLQAWFASENWGHVIWNCDLDLHNGIVTAPQIVALYNGGLTSCKYELPTDVVFTYAYLGDPFVARYPSSGYAGTAFSQAGLSIEREIYDESLAIGRERGNPITSQQRIAEFTQLATTIWEDVSDVAYAGTIVLDGIVPDYMFLNTRINLKCFDGDGNVVNSDFNTAAIPVTEVDYDWEALTTTLTLNGDLLELFGEDIQILKARAGIRTIAQLSLWHFRIDPIPGGYKLSMGWDIAYYDPNSLNIWGQATFVDTSPIIGR